MQFSSDWDESVTVFVLKVAPTIFSSKVQTGFFVYSIWPLDFIHVIKKVQTA